MYQNINIPPVIIPANQKGGVGKTEEAIILAEWFSLVRNKRVLLIDTDMQCNCTDHFVGMELSPGTTGGMLPPVHPDYQAGENMEERSTVTDLFEGKIVLPYPTWINNNGDPNKGLVDVICGHPEKLETINAIFYKPQNLPINRDIHHSLKSFIEEQSDPEDPDYLTIKDLYDIVIIDTGPSRTPLFRAAIRAASHAIIPFRPNKRDIQGMTAMLQVVENENYNRPNDDRPLELIGLLPNMVRIPRTITESKNLQDLLELHSDIMFPEESWLNLLKAFPERDIEGSRPRSIFELPENDLARKQSTAMAIYVEQSIFGSGSI